MKTFYIALLLCITSVTAFSQTHKVTVYCTINTNAKVYYGDLKKLLPDTLATKLLIDPRALYGLKDAGHTLLLMSNKGWKLASVETSVTGGGIISSSSNYLMSKEIYLDNSAYANYIQTLVNIEKKPAKK